MKELMKKIVKLLIFVLVITLITSFVLVKLNMLSINNIIDALIILCFINIFIGLHFIFGAKRLYEYIIKNRYLISGIILIFFSVLGYSGISQDIGNNTGYLILNNNCSIAVTWNFRMIALILVTFELCMIITDSNKFYSLAGSIIIAFSSFVQWRFATTIVDVLILGELILVLTDIIFNNKNNIIKTISSIGILGAIILILFTYDAENIVSFGYIFLAIEIWILIKNINNKKNNRKDLLFFLIPIIGLIAFLGSYYVINGKMLNIFINLEMQRNNYGFSLLYSYVYNMFLPFKNINNAYYFSGILSVFPIPLLIAFYYLYKKDKHIEFLMPAAIIGTIEIVECISGLPSIIESITLFKYASIESLALAIGLLNVYVYIYILSNINEKVFNIKYAIRITLITACILAFVARPTILSTKAYLSPIAIIYCLTSFLLLKLDDKKYKKVFLLSCVLITLIGSITINPIVKNNNIILGTKIPFAKVENLYK